MGGILQVNAAGASGEDNPDGPQLLHFFQGPVVGMHLAVDSLFPDPPGNQLIVLAAEVQDQNRLMACHRLTPIFAF